MKGWAKWTMLLLLLALLQGTGLLPGGKEMEELALITALAVDREDGKVLVTAVTGTRQSQGEDAELLTGRGGDLAAACRDMELSRPVRPYLGQVRQILLGEDTAREGWGGTFDYILSGGTLRLDTLLYIVRGRAGTGLSDSLKLTSEGGTAEVIRGRTVGAVLARLAEQEWVMLPLLSQTAEGTLRPSGWAIAGPDGVTDILEGAAAQGAAMLTGLGKGDVVVFSEGSVELREVRCRAADGRLVCRLTAKRSGGVVSEQELNAWGAYCIREALIQSKGRDCWNLERSQRVWGKKAVSPEKLEIEVKGTVVE